LKAKSAKIQRTRRGPRGPKLSALQQPPHLEFFNRYEGALPEIIGTANLAILNAALGFLFAHLRDARRQFEQEGDAGRAAAFTALGALWQFVALFEKPKAETLAIPILRLQDALASLDKNSVEPIVKPTRRQGRGGSSHVDLALIGHAAGTVRRLVAIGLNPSDAREEVAAQLHRLGIRAKRGSGNVTAGTVRNWCNEVSSDVSRNGTAAQVYDTMFTDAEERRFLTLSKADAKRFALGSLSYWVQSMFPGLKGKLVNPPI
jgi:hypothetical protein